jgi:hypothetical protein
LLNLTSDIMQYITPFSEQIGLTIFKVTGIKTADSLSLEVITHKCDNYTSLYLVKLSGQFNMTTICSWQSKKIRENVRKPQIANETNPWGIH